jgi:CheY-like chemotaxis protein
MPSTTAPAGDAGTVPHPSSPATGTGRHGARGPRIPRAVVADDDGDQRLLAEIAVRRAGVEVVAAVPDGEAALQRTLDERPDVVLLDVSMPGASGLEVCARLRADPRTTGLRIVLVSAAVREEAVRAGLAAGADAYVTKPFTVRDLSRQVAALVGVQA